MKASPIALSLAIALGTLVGTAQAQTVITTTPTPGPTTYSGVVSEINPTSQVIILKSPTASAPITYTYTPQTVFVDERGNTVSYEAIRNVPVTVEYYTEGDKTIVRRVVTTTRRVIEKDDD